MKTWNAINTLLIIALVSYIIFSKATISSANKIPKEISLERINIVEPNGKLKMVISNQERQHPGMKDGKVYKQRERPPGILFFSEEQDEIGGLSFYGNDTIGGNWLYLSFDQYKTDQIMQLMQYNQKDKNNKYGLQFWDRDKDLTLPVYLKIMDSLEKKGYRYRQKLKIIKEMNNGNPLVAERMFVGRNYNGSAGLFIQDKQGVDRLRIYIDSTDIPRIEVLDDKGELIQNIIKKLGNEN